MQACTCRAMNCNYLCMDNKQVWIPESSEIKRQTLTRSRLGPVTAGTGFQSTTNGGCFVCWLVVYRGSNMQVYLRDGSAQTILRAATLR